MFKRRFHILFLILGLLIGASSYAQQKIQGGGNEGSQVTVKSQFEEFFPNPASNNTTAEYILPSTAKSAKLLIYNVLGEQVKDIELNVNEKSIVLNVSDFKNGVYFYTFQVDGAAVLSKRLFVKR